MTTNTPAKINLCLDIIRKRADGYHELDMIMHEIPLYDIVTVEKSDGISLTCDIPDIPCDHTNIACKAALEFFKFTNINGGAKIHIQKEIPHGAGLGGGSSDGAAVIKLLNELYNAGLTNEQMEEIGLKIGADVPFFIQGGCAIAQGIGEKLIKLPEISGVYILLVKPDFSINTKWAYSQIDFKKFPQHISTAKIADAVKSNNISYIAKNTFNMLETAVNNKDIENIKATMKLGGADGAIMSGSGSCVFGLFSDKGKAELCKKEFENNVNFTKLLQMV